MLEFKIQFDNNDSVSTMKHKDISKLMKDTAVRITNGKITDIVGNSINFYQYT